MKTATELLGGVYDAFNLRDIESILTVMHPDVDWPNGWEGGRIYGRQAVRDYWTRQWAALNPHVYAKGFSTQEDGRIVVSVHQLVRDLEGQVIFDGMVEHVYDFVDGLIKSMEIKPHDGRDG